MIIGTRLRKLREAKKLSQGDIEDKTGMLRCYISRVENGHTVPSLETIERFAAALEVPVHELFYEDSRDSVSPMSSSQDSLQDAGRGVTLRPEDEKFLRKFQNAVASLRDRDRQLLLTLAGRMAVASQS